MLALSEKKKARERRQEAVTIAIGRASGPAQAATIGLGSNFPSIYGEAITAKTFRRLGMQLGTPTDGRLSPTSGQIEKPPRKPGKRWKKGAMKGKGGPENMACEFRGVRQRTWGKWVAEIREPKKRARLWLGSFSTAQEAALAYDIAARKLYGASAELNLSPQESLGLEAIPTSPPSNLEMHDVEITEHVGSTNVGSSSRTAMHIAIADDEGDLVETKSGRAFSNLDTREIFLHDRDGGATPSSSAQQQQQLETPADLKDIEVFLDQIDFHYTTPTFSSMDDDNDCAASGGSNDSRFSPSAAMADQWEDSNLGEQFLNLELQSLDSVLNEPLELESHVQLWDTRDVPPRQ